MRSHDAGSKIDAPDWLTARPIAHRGLHAKAKGLIENTIAAAEAAIGKGYAIECDIQRARDDEAVVFHDFTLGRLMRAEGRLDDFSAGELAAFEFRDCDQRLATLPQFLDAVRGRTPVVIEIKSRFDGDLRLAERALTAISGYAGPVCLKSFDPYILAYLRGGGVSRPLGLVAQARYEESEWPELTDDQRRRFGDLRDFPDVRPDFLSWGVDDLPHAVPMLCRAGVGMPVMTWTVRTPEAQRRAALWADQMIFEGFEP